MQCLCMRMLTFSELSWSMGSVQGGLPCEECTGWRKEGVVAGHA
jgi:hypothetical protein